MYTAIGLFHSHLLSRAGCSFDRFRKQRAHLVGGAWGPSNISRRYPAVAGRSNHSECLEMRSRSWLASESGLA